MGKGLNPGRSCQTKTIITVNFWFSLKTNVLIIRIHIFFQQDNIFDRFVDDEDFLNLFISSLNYHKVHHKAHPNQIGRERKQSLPFLTLDCGDYRKTRKQRKRKKVFKYLSQSLLPEPEWWKRAWTLNQNAGQ